jgi:hypothetical protein
VDWLVEAKVSEKLTVSIFRAEDGDSTQYQEEHHHYYCIIYGWVENYNKCQILSSGRNSILVSPEEKSEGISQN